MSVAPSTPENVPHDTQNYSFFGRIKFVIATVFPVLLLLSTGVLFFQTWVLQNSCNPIVSSGAEACPIASVHLRQSNIVLNPGDSKQISAQIDLKPEAKDARNADLGLIWMSGDRDVFLTRPIDEQGQEVGRLRQWGRSVSSILGQLRRNSDTEQGVVKGIQPGQATLTVASAKEPDKFDTAIVTTRGIQAIHIHPNPLTVRVGSEFKEKLEAEIVQFGNVDQSVEWSTDSDKVEVSPKGIVTGLAEGKATVIATSRFDPTRSARVPVTVRTNIIIDSIQVQSENPKIWQGDEAQLTVTVQGNGASSDQVSWESSNRRVAQIHGQGHQLVMWAGHLNKPSFYLQTLHIEWMLWTIVFTFLFAIWAYRQNRSFG
jgi:hypothetical protein